MAISLEHKFGTVRLSAATNPERNLNAMEILMKTAFELHGFTEAIEKTMSPELYLKGILRDALEAIENEGYLDKLSEREVQNLERTAYARILRESDFTQDEIKVLMDEYEYQL